MTCCRGVLLATSNQYGRYLRSLFGPSPFGWTCRPSCSNSGGLKYCSRRHGGYECTVVRFHRHCKLDLSSDLLGQASLLARVVLVAQRWSEGGEHGVAVKLATGDRLLQAPIGYMAERRGPNQSWRYRIHRLKSQIEYARSGGFAYVSASLTKVE